MAREQSFVTRSSTADTANRDPDDFYPTPPQATHALLKIESFRGRIWEPACGDGASHLHFLRSGDVNNAGGGGMVAYAWYVWDHDHTGPTELHHLPPFEKESK